MDSFTGEHYRVFNYTTHTHDVESNTRQMLTALSVISLQLYELHKEIKKIANKPKS